jgi:hypothetical protein
VPFRSLGLPALLIVAAATVAFSSCGHQKKVTPTAGELPLASGLSVAFSQEDCEAYDYCRRVFLLAGPPRWADAAIATAEQRKLRGLGWRPIRVTQSYALGFGKPTGERTKEIDAVMYSERFQTSQAKRRICRKTGLTRTDQIIGHKFDPLQGGQSSEAVPCLAVINVNHHRPGLIVELSYEHLG